ncbi:hypothetical protein V5O48_005796 [Marasmius crinis-equi]|uniref:Uncharacterized protein n=1 Tax=Marasmius crinis-equi TaxID=585013 RepID=A0ABR3FL95_9AGAR
MSPGSPSHISETQFLSSMSFTSSTSSTLSNSLLVNTTTPNNPERHGASSRQATAVMEFAQAQMGFVDAAKRFIALTNDTDTVYSALRNIKRALGFNETDSTSNSSFSLPSTLATPSTPLRTTTTAPIHLTSPESSSSFEERAARVLKPLEKQTKSRRKPSYKVT